MDFLFVDLKQRRQNILGKGGWTDQLLHMALGCNFDVCSSRGIVEKGMNRQVSMRGTGEQDMICTVDDMAVCAKDLKTFIPCVF